jgi:hypothetical protein
MVGKRETMQGERVEDVGVVEHLRRQEGDGKCLVVAEKICVLIFEIKKREFVVD